uniref:T-complex protein 1 subunit gamma (inferred by orthology to a D. melanogaster protein) n=1 Tax=Strongyloides venezuelensis TaxID=75913 RepID=A0A0K0ETV7_STRVS
MNTRNEVQKSSIMTARATLSCIRTCLGPRTMLKTLIDLMGGIAMTNLGNAILQMACASDEKARDGTTSTIIVTGDLMAKA